MSGRSARTARTSPATARASEPATGLADQRQRDDRVRRRGSGERRCGERDVEAVGGQALREVADVPEDASVGGLRDEENARHGERRRILAARPSRTRLSCVAGDAEDYCVGRTGRAAHIRIKANPL